MARTGTDSDKTFTYVYPASAHLKSIPIIQVGEAAFNLSGDIISYAPSVLVSVNISVTDYDIPVRSGSDITIEANDIIITVDENSRFTGRVIAAKVFNYGNL